MSRLRALFQNRSAKNAGWMIGGKIVHMLISLLVGLLTARYLGPSNYGLLNYAAVYTTFFFSLCTLGINSTIVKNFTDDPERSGATIGTTLVLRGVSSVISVIIILLIVFIVDNGEPFTIQVIFLSSIGLVFQVCDTVNYWFQWRLESKYTALATTAAYIVVSGYKLILLIMQKDVRWFALATSVDYICIAVWLAVAYKKRGGPELSFSWEKARELLRESYHYILAGLMVSLYSGTDKLMLKQMLTDEAVGYYTTAVQICNMWVFVLTAIIDSVNPVIMEKHEKDPAGYTRTNRRLYAIVFYISAFVSVIICVCGDVVVGVLYGEKYAPAAEPLRIITWYVAFSYLGVARNAWIVCEGQQKYLLPLYVGAAATNIVLNAFLIPILGTVGAAWATLVTQASTVIIFPWFIKELRSNAHLMLDAICLRGIK